MQIKTTRQVNARTWDGRAVAAGEGEVIDIDDDDAGLVGLAKSLISSGQAEFYGDAGTVNGGEDEPDPEVRALEDEPSNSDPDARALEDPVEDDES